MTYEAKSKQQKLIRSLKDLFNFFMWNPEANLRVMPILLILESIALKYIQFKVPYTEIDYTAYMEQIEMIHNGELDYSKIRGGTGPLVYPAGHVMVYKLMNYFTNGTHTLNEGQTIFRYLYVLTLIAQFACYHIVGIPPAYIIFSVFSKRLHSIYILRLFNDCFTTFFIVLTVLWFLLSSKYNCKWASMLANFFFALAVSIKMNALLYLPAILLTTYYLNNGRLLPILNALLITLVLNLILAYPYISTYPDKYFQSAFNFSRQFLQKWSVNWQFINPSTFSSSFFHRSLLILHLSLLLIFLSHSYSPLPFTKSLSAFTFSLRHPNTSNPYISSQQTHPAIIAYILLTTNFIGIICARSLHYQFLAWYHWTLPALLFWSRIPYPAVLLWYPIHEWTWIHYPPSPIASFTLFLCNAFLLLFLFRASAPITNSSHHVLSRDNT